MRLQHRVAGQPAGRADVERPPQPRGVMVRRADGPHLAVADQPIERLQRVLERHRRVVVVREVQVDAVGPEPLQRSVDRRGDPRRRQPLGAAHLGADLRRDQDVVAPAALAQPRADDRLRFAAAVARHPGRVAVGGVNHPPAAGDERVEDREGRLPIGRPAEHVAAEDQRRGRQPARAECAFVRHVAPCVLRISIPRPIASSGLIPERVALTLAPAARIWPADEPHPV